MTDTTKQSEEIQVNLPNLLKQMREEILVGVTNQLLQKIKIGISEELRRETSANTASLRQEIRDEIFTQLREDVHTDVEESQKNLKTKTVYLLYMVGFNIVISSAILLALIFKLQILDLLQATG